MDIIMVQDFSVDYSIDALEIAAQIIVHYPKTEFSAKTG